MAAAMLVGPRGREEGKTYGPKGARGQEEVLGTTSGDGSGPIPSAEPVWTGSALLWSTGGSCLSEEKLAMAPENQFMA